MQKIFLMGIFALTGCANNQYPITYTSDIEGAVLICQGVNKGYTPTTLYYALQEEHKKTGWLKTQTCEAQWYSGAAAVYENVYSLREYPSGVQQTVRRPQVSGRDQDMVMALAVQYQRAQINAAQRQATAAERQASAASSQAREAANANFQKNLQNTTPKFYNMTPNYMGGYNIIQY